MSAAPLHLRVESLSKYFGPLAAVNNVSLGILKGSITGLIGPNGAGKSTLFDTLAGDTQADNGRVYFNDKPLKNHSADQVFRQGLARTFQIPQPFPEMTVLDNLMLAAPGQLGETVWGPVFRPAAIKRQEAEHLERAFDVLKFTTLHKVAELAAKNLSGGQQKLLELARVLMGKPELILLDEPAAGVNPVLTALLLEKIHALNDEGITFLIIEHNMELVMQHCNPIIAMANGEVIFQGNASQALECEELLDSYLGDMGGASQ
ncbi:MAG: ABC transporter ATP-binding protein [Granulosicoccus sp.]